MSDKNEKLDRIIDTGAAVAEKGIDNILKGAFVALTGAALTAVCPPAAPFVASVGIGMMGGGAITTVGGSAAAVGAKIKKEIDNF